MKPEDSVVPANAAIQTTEQEAQSAAPAQAVAERKTKATVVRKKRTPASMALLKKAKRASHRRQIRRSHANG
jgi:hypothetical protein